MIDENNIKLWQIAEWVKKKLNPYFDGPVSRKEEDNEIFYIILGSHDLQWRRSFYSGDECIIASLETHHYPDHWDSL